MINKKSLRDKNKLDEAYRTDPPQDQAGIPDPPKLFDKIERNPKKFDKSNVKVAVFCEEGGASCAN